MWQLISNIYRGEFRRGFVPLALKRKWKRHRPNNEAWVLDSPLPAREGAGGWVGERSEPSYARAMRPRIDPELTRRARALRNNPTPTGLAIWHRIARYRAAFTGQLVVVPFIIDLACRKAKLGVEFDGSQHAAQIEADGRRTAFLERRGWRIIRLWNSDVLANPDGAVL